MRRADRRRTVVCRHRADRRGRHRGQRHGRRGFGPRRPAPAGRDRGAAVVELAVIWPVVVLAVFGAVQVTTYFTARTVALSAAQAAVSAERRYDAVPGVGEQRAEQFLAGSGDWLVDAEIDEPVRTGEEVRVTVRGRALSVLPGIDWEIEQTARGTVERFTEGP